MNVGGLPISKPPKAKFVNVSFAQRRFFMATVTELDTYKHNLGKKDVRNIIILKYGIFIKKWPF